MKLTRALAPTLAAALAAAGIYLLIDDPSATITPTGAAEPSATIAKVPETQAKTPPPSPTTPDRESSREPLRPTQSPSPSPSASLDDRARPMTAGELQQLMDQSYPHQYGGPDRATLVAQSWRLAQPEIAGTGYEKLHLQASAVTALGSDTNAPAVVDVTLMWAGDSAVLGPADRRLSRWRATRNATGEWVLKQRIEDPS